MKKRLLIGVIITSCDVTFQEEILKGIISQSFRSNCDIAVLSAMHDFSLKSPHRQQEKNIFELILSDRFDGFIYDRNVFYSEKMQEHIDGLLERSGKPTMLVDSADHRLFESTAIDDCSAFEQITDHLIDVHGCNRIYCLTGPRKLFVSEERLSGFRNSMKKHGLYYDRNSCIYGDFWKDAAKELADKITGGIIPKPDAVVCGNDCSAISLIESLREGGLDVPRDLLVTGYDDTAEAKKFSPSVTTFRRPNFQLGAESFRRLYRIITGKICQKVLNRDGGIIYGGSCGCTAEKRTDRKADRRNAINKKLEADMMNRDMTFDISSVDNVRDFADRLDNYTYYIYKLKHIEICLTRKFIELDESPDFRTGDEVKTILSKSTRRNGISDTYFSSSEIAEPFGKNLPYPSAYYISPLHYNNNFFGYSCISFGKEAMSFSYLYNYWLNTVNLALEQLRLRAMLSRSLLTQCRNSLYDENTKILNRNGIEKALADFVTNYDGQNTLLEFIRIQLTGLSKVYFQNGEEKCLSVTRCIAEFINGIMQKGEICGMWSNITICIVTPFKGRNEKIISSFVDMIKKSRFSSEEDCNIDFTAGLYVQEINTVQNLSNAMHKASVNKIFNYSISECNLNPQFEKICVLRNKIMKNPELPWSIDNIADGMYLSKSYLQKIYKTYFGKGIIEEMIEFRIEKAKNLLSGTDLTITEISKECGYSSYNYFVRQFKSAVGLSPTEYRDDIRKNKGTF